MTRSKPSLIQEKPSHVNGAQDDKGQPKFLITKLNWVVSLVRNNANRASEHAFLIIEGIENDEEKLFLIDFLGRNNSCTTGKGTINVVEYPEKKPDSEKPLLFRSDTKLLGIDKRTELMGISWNITHPEAKRIIENAEHQEQNQDLDFFITGHGSWPSWIVETFSVRPNIEWNKGVDGSYNCYSWARKLLEDSVNKEHQSKFKDLHSGFDLMASVTSRYLTEGIEPNIELIEKDINFIYNIEENADFIGRESYLVKLEEVLFPKHLQENEIPRKVVSQKEIGVITHGAGGIGKSSIARQYAQEHKKIHQVVFSINISGQMLSTEDAKNNLDAGFRALARKLNTERSKLGIIKIEKINEDSAMQTGIREDVYERLGQLGGKQLLIFDDAKDYESIKDYLPQSNNNPNVQVIITSRNANLEQWKKENIFPVELDIFPPEISMLHLLKGVAETQNKEAEKKGGKQVINPDALEEMISKFLNNEELSEQKIEICKSAQSLSETLYNYPLALTHAIAYMNNIPKLSGENTIFDKYKKLYGDPKNKDLIDGVKVPDYTRTMSKSLELSTNLLKESSPEAYNLMMMLIFMNNKDIDENLIRSCLSHVREEENNKVHEDRIIAVIEVLKSHSLITGANSPFQIHDMVQETIINSLKGSKKDYQKYGTNVVIILNRSYQSNQYENGLFAPHEGDNDLKQHLRVAISFYKDFWGEVSDENKELLLESYKKLIPMMYYHILESDLTIAALANNLELFKWLVEVKEVKVNKMYDYSDNENSAFKNNRTLYYFLVEDKFIEEYDNSNLIDKTFLQCTILSNNLEFFKWLVEEKGVDVLTTIFESDKSFINRIRELTSDSVITNAIRSLSPVIEEQTNDRNGDIVLDADNLKGPTPKTSISKANTANKASTLAINNLKKGSSHSSGREHTL